MRARFLRGLILALSSLTIAAGLFATNVPAAQAVGPSGIQICNSINSDFLWLRPYYDDSSGRHWGEYRWPGGCYEMWNGSDPGPLRVRFETGTNSFYIKEYRTGRVSPCDSSPTTTGTYTWNPADSNNGYRIDVDLSKFNGCA